LALEPHLLLHAGFNRRFLDVPFSVVMLVVYGQLSGI
jgi:hypothetical protein